MLVFLIIASIYYLIGLGINHFIYKDTKPTKTIYWFSLLAALFFSIILDAGYKEISGLKLSPFLMAVVIFGLTFRKPSASKLSTQVAQTKLQSPPITTKLAQTSEISETKKQLPTAQINSMTALTVGNEDLWAQALAEFDSDQRKTGLWAHSYAEADGNEATAKARYIKTRANALIAESEALLLAKQKERAEQAQMIEENRLAAIAAKLLSEPKGECPNCESIIPVESSNCAKCKAIFKTDTGENTNWAVKPLTAFDLRARE